MLQELLLREREEQILQEKLEDELEEQRLLYEKWKKKKYCKELVEQAALYKKVKQQEELEEQHLDQQLLEELLLSEMKRERKYGTCKEFELILCSHLIDNEETCLLLEIITILVIYLLGP